MVKYKLLGSCVLCELVFQNSSDIIHIEQSLEDVDKFGVVVGIGPDVEEIKIGDSVLIPPSKTGRELIAEGEKRLAIFEEHTAMLIKENI